MEAEGEQFHAQENNNPIGVYGWRKRCLYFFVLLLVVILLVNLGLTIWIVLVLKFNLDGMGSLRITDSGIRLEGTADFVGALHAQTISADQNSSLLLHSNSGVEVSVNGTSSLNIDSNVCNVTAPSVQVFSPSATTPSLTVNQEGVSVDAQLLDVRGSLGLTLNGPLETQTVRAPAGEDLEVLSPSGQITLTGSQGVRIEDGVGFTGIDITGSDDVTITSRFGTVSLDSQTVRLPGLRRASSEGNIYEVCACSSGELYLVPASSTCDNHNGICS